jgi:hypothetical protein
MSDIESHASVVVQPLKPFAVSPREAALLENCGRSLIYERLARGEYQAVKDGNRTKILVESIEKRRASLPSYHLNKCSPPPPPHKRSRKRRKVTA